MIQDGIGYATEDVSGAYLDPVLVAEARKVEMKFFEDMKVYDRVDRAEMQRRGGNIIKTRWIDANQERCSAAELNFINSNIESWSRFSMQGPRRLLDYYLDTK